MGPNRTLALARDLLRSYPGLFIKPTARTGVVIEGSLSFSCTSGQHPSPVSDVFAVRIFAPDDMPDSLPTVEEIGGRIPKHQDYHMEADGTICLETPFRIRMALRADPSLLGFVEDFLVPYLFGASVKLSGGDFPQGGWAHGPSGLLEDGRALFGLQVDAQVLRAFELVGMCKREANKRPCPCGCGKRLGNCVFRFKLAKLREATGASWAREYAEKRFPKPAAKQIKGQPPRIAL